MSSDDQNDRYVPTADEWAQALKYLYWLRYEMHQTYANTSHRGRGIGGQAMTAQCHIVRMEGRENEQLQELDDFLYRSYGKRPS